MWVLTTSSTLPDLGVLQPSLLGGQGWICSEQQQEMSVPHSGCWFRSSGRVWPLCPCSILCQLPLIFGLSFPWSDGGQSSGGATNAAGKPRRAARSHFWMILQGCQSCPGSPGPGPPSHRPPPSLPAPPPSQPRGAPVPSMPRADSLINSRLCGRP